MKRVCGFKLKNGKKCRNTPGMAGLWVYCHMHAAEVRRKVGRPAKWAAALVAGEVLKHAASPYVEELVRHLPKLKMRKAGRGGVRPVLSPKKLAARPARVNVTMASRPTQLPKKR
jgi:hypothetical protein